MADPTAHRMVSELKRDGQYTFVNLYGHCLDGGRRDFRRAFKFAANTWPAPMQDAVIGYACILDTVDRLKPGDDIALLSTLHSAIGSKLRELSV